MKKLLLLVMVLWFGGSLAIFGIATISRIEAHKAGALSILGHCEEHPCFFGIAVGQASWDEAVALTSAVSHKLLDSKTLTVKPMDGVRVTLLRRGQNLTVDYLNIVFDTPQYDAGSIIAMYGTPCFVVINNVSNVIELNYPTATMGVRFSAGENPILLPKNAINWVIMRDRNICQTYLPANNPYSLRTSWQGFATLSHYFPSAHE